MSDSKERKAYGGEFTRPPAKVYSLKDQRVMDLAFQQENRPPADRNNNERRGNNNDGYRENPQNNNNRDN